MTFKIEEELRRTLAALLDEGQQPPQAVTVTRYYPQDPTKDSYTTRYSFDPRVPDRDAPVSRLIDVLKRAEKAARLITSPSPEQEAERIPYQHQRPNSAL